MKATKMLVILVLVLCGAASADAVSWIAGESCLPGWSISPTNPTTYDSVHFSGAVSFFSNSCFGEAQMGGTPSLTIDPVGKTIKLWFQGPAPSTCPLIYSPVCGLEGDFGPLEAGDWRFFCDHTLATFSINFTVRAAGTNGGGGGFPCPAYDSGWVAINQGERKELIHGLGGNVDNYVVDMQFKKNPGVESQQGIHNINYGTDRYTFVNQSRAYGASWSRLTTNSVSVTRAWDDNLVDWVRIRIWVYQCEPVPPTPPTPPGVCCYEPGDRVILLEDDPRQAVDLPAGTLGTVLCCDADDPALPILVSWDEWNNGYNRDSFCDIPPPFYPDDSAYWMSCDQIEGTSAEGYFDECGVLIRDVQGTVACVLFEADSGGHYLLDNHYGFEVGDRIRVRGLFVFCLTLVCDVDGCIRHCIISQCAE